MIYAMDLKPGYTFQDISETGPEWLTVTSIDRIGVDAFHVIATDEEGQTIHIYLTGTRKLNLKDHGT